MVEYAALHKLILVFLWLSGKSIALAAQRLWVRFPGNTHTDNINV